VDNPTSVENVVKTWVPEIQEFCELCPVILVACKKDLRTDPQTIAELKKTGENPVTRERGLQLAAEMKADAYMECSAKTREGVQDLFLYAARLSLRKRSRKLSTISCVLY
jgi:Ras family protein A